MEFVELICRSNFSFLMGASHVEDIVERANQLNYLGIGLLDRNGVYAAPKAWLKRNECFPDLKLHVGAEVILEDRPSLFLMPRNRESYGLLCRILTKLHEGKEKSQGRISWEELLVFFEDQRSQELLCFPSETLLPHHSLARSTDYETLFDLFQGRLYLPAAFFLDGWDQERLKKVDAISKRFGIHPFATNNVYYHEKQRGRLQDVFVSVRELEALKGLGYYRFSNHERYMKTVEQMKVLFSSHLEWLKETVLISEQCHFDLGELRYRYPSEWIPEGMTAQEYLESLVDRGANSRFPQGLSVEVKRQLEHELFLIKKMNYADYFLTIWDVVDFARKRQILCQGRGSAANSAVCYVLGITAIDPVRMKLLFERFISEERNEPPDIDVDFEHERREEVLQYVYGKYGRDRAAMLSAVVTYRSRSSMRDLEKAFDETFDGEETEEIADLKEQMESFPRHLSIHSGGFTLSADPIIEIVPVEPARMEKRTIIQWDKYDLEALGLLKVDLLCLGMLSAIRKALHQLGMALETIPSEDPKTYEMIQKGDTIGVFQIESRAQMGMLARLKPKTFYDLVIQVAIVRPGPIVGKMVHPYLKRRRGEEPVFYYHPSLKSILKRTLGVPLFQEQVMKMAIAVAGFTPGEADQLRKSIAAWRGDGKLNEWGKKLMLGLQRSGIPDHFSERIMDQIRGFAEYGFPESHAVSFALLAYASSYLKCHHPAEFAMALLNSQPMGFYAVHTLLDDAKRHGVCLLPVHPNFSENDCLMEGGKLRLGFRLVKGMSKEEANRIVGEREKVPFDSLSDFLVRTRLRKNVLQSLALSDAFRCFGFEQREALWELLRYSVFCLPGEGGQLNLLAQEERDAEVLFPAFSRFEKVKVDYQVLGHSDEAHPMEVLRENYPHLPQMCNREVRSKRVGTSVKVAGLAIVKQRPHTAKGFVFMTLEDETGFLDLVIKPPVYERYRQTIQEHAFLVAQGYLEKDGDAINLLVRTLRPLWVEEGRSQSKRAFHPRNFHFWR